MNHHPNSRKARQCIRDKFLAPNIQACMNRVTDVSLSTWRQHKRFLRPLLLFFILVLALNPIRADIIPTSFPAEIQTLRNSKNIPLNKMTLSWSDGVGPFTVVRAENPVFDSTNTFQYIATGVSSSPADDLTGLPDTKSYFYLIYDSYSNTEVFTDTSTQYFTTGQVITLNGVGFTPGSTNILLEGQKIVPTSVSSTQLQFDLTARNASGELMVQSANGLSKPRQLNFVYLNNHADFTHVAVDNNHDAWVVERGTAPTSDQNYKINHLTGAVTPFVTINEPVGQPHDSANNQYSCNSLITATNTGTIRLTSPAGAQSNFPISACTGGTPCYCRALAINPANNAPATLTVYFMDANSGFIKAVTNAGRSNYQNVGISMPNPGGIDIDPAGNMFYTQDANTVPEIILATNAPVFTYNAALGINNPAQISVENNKRIWLANRGGNNILRISTDPTEPPGPASRKVLAKVSGLLSPRGVAFDHDPTVDPASGLSYSWIYTAEQTRFSRFRIYDTVWISIKILLEANIQPDTGTRPVDISVIQDKALNDFLVARQVWKQAGIDLRLRGIAFLGDPNPHSGTPGTFSPRSGMIGRLLSATCPFTESGEQSTLLSTARSSNNKDINVYYVSSIYNLNQMPAPGPSGAVATTLTNDFFPLDNKTQAGIFVATFVYDSVNARYVRYQGRNSIGHELGHFLIDSPCVDEHVPGDPTNFLYPYSAAGALMTPAQINNIQTNLDESEFIDRF